MATVVGVRFKTVGKVYYFDPAGEDYPLGSRVIVETSRGIECGEVAMKSREVPDDSVVKPLKTVIRAATPEDLARLEENLFYFTADGRVDFRELVKDLASVFRTRIELRQIGVRDEAKMLGGLGICGRPFCCSTFLGDFQPVSIKMAKEQGLSLNPGKISGACGRLMCCLKYEQEAYEDLIRRTPKVGFTVSTPDGEGTVVEVSLLTGALKVRLSSGDSTTENYYNKSEVRVLRGKRPRNEEPAEE